MRSKLFLGTAMMASLFALSACGEQDTISRTDDDRVVIAPAQPGAPNAVNSTATGKDGQITASNGKAELSGDTREYVQMAAMGDLFEVEASRLALSRSPTAEIKQFAQEMVDAHTKTSDDLKARLVRAGLIVELPTTLDEDHKAMLDDLRASNAREFDANYIEQQKEAHEAALMLHRDYAMNGDAADLKALAADTVPKIEMHVQMATDLQNKLRTRVTNADKR